MYEQRDKRFAPDEAGVIEIGPMIAVLWGGKWIILATSLLAAALAAWLSLQIPNRYTAVTRILIDPQRSQIVGLMMTEGERPLNEALVESKSYLARSTTVLDSVVQRLALSENEEFIGGIDDGQAEDIGITPEALRIRLAMSAVNQALTVRPVGSSFLIDIHAETYAPQLSAEIANAVAEAFLDAELRRKREETKFANDWILERLDDLQERVMQSASTMETFRLQSGDVTELDLTELSRRLERLQERAAAANGDVPEVLQESIERTDRELREMTSQVIRQRQLERKATADQVLYERLLARAGELQEAATFQTSDSVIVSKAMPPLGKSGPKRKLITLLGGILGGATGVLVAVGLAMRHRSRGRVED